MYNGLPSVTHEIIHHMCCTRQPIVRSIVPFPTGNKWIHTMGACWNTLYSWPKCSSSSRMEATLPHLSIVNSQWWNRIERRSSPVAIIGSTPNCDNCLIKHELESIHGKLMCSGDEVDGIVVCETFRDVSAKQKPGTARRETPSRNILGVWEIMGGEAILCAYRRGRTIKDRTWLRREGLPVFYR